MGAVLAFGQCFFHPPPAFAEFKTVEADGEYIMGDGPEENPGTAKKRARQEAMRIASESVCVFVEAFAESIDGELTREQIRTVSAAVLEVLKEDFDPVVEGKTIKFIYHVTVIVDKDNVLEYIRNNLNQIDAQTRQMQEVLAENARLKEEIQRLKRDYKNANETERKRNIY